MANHMAWQAIEDALVQRWCEAPTWLCFSGNAYFEHQWPCGPTQLGRFSKTPSPRKALSEEGVEELLPRTMEVEVAKANGIEPIIGLLVTDYRMDRCHLNGSESDALHAVVCDAGYFHLLVAADDFQERPKPFVVPAAGERFGGLF